MNIRIFSLFVALFSFSELAVGQTVKLSCSHPEICTLAKSIATEQGQSLDVESIVSISGDPHEFEPSISEIKKLMSAPFLIEGPFELNPWIKKVNYQRTKNLSLKTSTLNLSDRLVALYTKAPNGHTKEALAHFWLYPKIHCDFKAELTKVLVEAKIIVLKNKTDNCLQKAGEFEASLRSTLIDLTMPIILTHDALWPLMQTLKEKNTMIVAIKGSGHHEEASTDSVKKLYDALKAPKAIWIEEKGINIPPTVLNKKRSADIVIHIDTANSSALNLLNEELKKLKGKK